MEPIDKLPGLSLDSIPPAAAAAALSFSPKKPSRERKKDALLFFLPPTIDLETIYSFSTLPTTFLSIESTFCQSPKVAASPEKR